MSDQPIVGLVAALLVEARHWTRLRWEFDERAFLRAWYVSIVLILFGAVSVWLDGPSSRRIYSLFAWLPVLLLPVQFVQSFGTRETVPVHIFSVVAHSRIKREQKLGHSIEIPEINFGYVTLAVVLLGSSLGPNADGWLFLPGALALAGWALRSNPAGRSRWLPWIVSLLTVAALGVGGQLGIDGLNTWIASGMTTPPGGSDINSFRSRIDLGGLADHKNSPRIFWRLRDAEGGVPALLRSASYNTYVGGTWLFRNHTDSRAFESMTIVSDDTGNEYWIASEEGGAISDPAPANLPSFTLTGAVDRHSLLPMPVGTRSLRNPRADSLELNPLGTMRIEPKYGIIDTRVAWQDQRNLETDPWLDEFAPDLLVPKGERDGLRQIVDQLQLEQGDLTEKINKLRIFFLREFNYARYLSIHPANHFMSYRHRGNAISRFLLKGRRGHCEYFASATALLLREAGVPARYSIGFASVEHGINPGEIIYRGTHAHAWCRAWDAETGRWIDVDLTPPDWSSREARGLGAWQRFTDWWQRVREDLLAWRTRPGNADRLNIAMIIIGIVIAAYIALRLWQSRRRNGRPLGIRREPPTLPAPLRPLVRLARNEIGPRPPGMPLGHWLRLLEQPLGPSPELDQLITLHARLRFDPATPDPDDESHLAEIAATLQHRLRHRPCPTPHIVR